MHLVSHVCSRRGGSWWKRNPSSLTAGLVVCLISTTALTGALAEQGEDGHLLVVGARSYIELCDLVLAEPNPQSREVMHSHQHCCGAASLPTPLGVTEKIKHEAISLTKMLRKSKAFSMQLKFANLSPSSPKILFLPYARRGIQGRNVIFMFWQE